MYLISREWTSDTPYYFYKTTNLISNKFYYGSGTDKENYLGSGTAFNNAIRKYGKENFKIEKLRFFETRKDAYHYEDRFLNLFDLKNIKESYNLKNSALGIDSGTTTYKDCSGRFYNSTKKNAKEKGLVHGYTNLVTAKDKKDKTLCVTKTEFDNRNDLVGCNSELVTVKDNNGNTSMVSINDIRYLSSELVSYQKNMVIVQDENGIRSNVNINDKRYLSGELVAYSKNKVTVKDNNGNTMRVATNDPRYLNGELTYHLADTILVKDKKGNKFHISPDDTRYIIGELFGHTKGDWVWNNRIQINNMIKIAKEWKDFYSLVKLSELKSHLISNNIKFEKL